MKGKMTRTALVFLSLLLLLGSLAGCGQNSSVLELPEGTASTDNTAQETPGPLTPLGDRTCKVGIETIPESTLFSFILKEASFDPLQGLTLKMTFTNKSPARSFVVSLSYLSVNGYMQDTGFEKQVAAGQTAEGEIAVSAASLRSAGVSSVDELILYPLIYDESMPMGQGDVVDGAFSFYPSGQSARSVLYPVRQTTSTEQTFFDTAFGTVIVLDAQEDGEEGLNVHCYLENKTERFLSFAWSDVTVNNAPTSDSGETIVAPGMRRYVTMPLSADLAEGSENSVTFKMSATPLSSTGETLSPLVEQRGTYRVNGGTGTGTGTGGDEPGVTAAPGVTASPSPTLVIYTTPTAAQKKNAKNGYITKDKVNMRSGPGTKYKTVGNKLDQNTTVILYELQEGWWFLKAGSKYGYVKADYVAQGKPKATAQPDTDSKTFDGVVTVQTKAALRKSADPESKCIKELSDGTKVTVHYKTKGKDGHMWYYVTVGKNTGYIRSDLVKVTGKVPTK